MSSISSWLSSPPNNFSTTLSSGVTNNALTIPLNSVTSLPTEGVGVIFKKDADGAVDATTVEFIHWTNVSGLSLTLTDTGDRGIDGSYGAAAQAHDANDYFEVWVSSQYYSSQRAGFVAEHSVAGVHDTTKVAMLAGTQTFTGDKTFSGSVSLPSGVALTSPSITGDVGLATGANIQVNSADPYRTIVIPAGSMSPTTTAGCASVATVEAGTNDVDYKTLDFDTTTVESAFTLFQMPNNWDGGTITFKPVWTAASGSGTVCFGLKGRAFADDDAIDQAYGTEQTSTDTLITAGDVHIGPESSAITLAGTPAGGQLVQLKITRQTGSDTLGVDARLIGIRILYKIAQYSD